MKGMKLTKPCAQCPFRTDIKPFLNRERAQELAIHLIKEQRSFTCHKTINYDGCRDRSKEEQCAGAMIMLMKMGKPNQLMQVMSRLGAVNLNKLDLSEPVFDTADDFIKANDK